MNYRSKLECFNARKDYKSECDRVANLITPIAKRGPVLDIGCGAGGMINVLRNRGINVIGVDPNSDLLNALGGSNTLQSVGESLPFSAATFSAAYYMHSFAHLNAPRSSLKEVSRLLKKDGRVLIVTPNSNFEALINPIKRILKIIGKYNPDVTVQKHYSPRELEGLLSQYFNVEQISTFGVLGLQRIIAVATK